MAAGRQSSTGEEEEEVYNARRERRVCAETCLFFDETGPSWQLLNGENQLKQKPIDPILLVVFFSVFF